MSKLNIEIPVNNLNDVGTFVNILNKHLTERQKFKLIKLMTMKKSVRATEAEAFGTLCDELLSPGNDTTIWKLAEEEAD